MSSIYLKKYFNYIYNETLNECVNAYAYNINLNFIKNELIEEIKKLEKNLYEDYELTDEDKERIEQFVINVVTKAFHKSKELTRKTTNLEEKISSEYINNIKITGKEIRICPVVKNGVVYLFEDKLITIFKDELIKVQFLEDKGYVDEYSNKEFSIYFYKRHPKGKYSVLYKTEAKFLIGQMMTDKDFKDYALGNRYRNRNILISYFCSKKINKEFLEKEDIYEYLQYLKYFFYENEDYYNSGLQKFIYTSLGYYSKLYKKKLNDVHKITNFVENNISDLNEQQLFELEKFYIINELHALDYYEEIERSLQNVKEKELEEIKGTFWGICKKFLLKKCEFSSDYYTEILDLGYIKDYFDLEEKPQLLTNKN